MLLLGVLHESWGRGLEDEKETDETLAEQWLVELDGNMVKVFSETSQASWNYKTNMTDENGHLLVNLEL